MISVLAKIKMHNAKYITTGVLNHNFKCSILANGTRYITETSTLNQKNVLLGKDVIARVKICYGEMDLVSFLPQKTFEYVTAEKIGEAEIIKLEELVFEADITNEIKKKEIRYIFEQYKENHE